MAATPPAPYTAAPDQEEDPYIKEDEEVEDDEEEYNVSGGVQQSNTTHPNNSRLSANSSTQLTTTSQQRPDTTTTNAAARKPSRTQEEIVLQSMQRQAIAEYNKLSHELHIPALDDALYRKYLLPSASSSKNNNAKYENDHQDEDEEEEVVIDSVRLSKLLRLINVLGGHKERTLRTLESIIQREQLLTELHQLCTNDTLTVLELQSIALHQLYALQRITLSIVEGIQAWRSELTLPYPFVFAGQNYILTIAVSMKGLEESAIGQVLPMNYKAYPLFSNVPSVGLFKEDHLTYPLRQQQASSPQKLSTSANNIILSSEGGSEGPMSAVYRKRLLVAEKYIHCELDLQLKTTKQLLVLCQAGYFLPIVDIEKCGIYPHLRPKKIGKGRGQSSTSMSHHQNPLLPQGHHKETGKEDVKQPHTSSSLSESVDFIGIKIQSVQHQRKLLDALLSTLDQLQYPFNVPPTPNEDVEEEGGKNNNSQKKGSEQQQGDDDDDDVVVNVINEESRRLRELELEERRQKGEEPSNEEEVEY